MHRPLLKKLDRWTVPYKTFLFIIQKEEQTPSNAAFGRANATRPYSFLDIKKTIRSPEYSNHKRK